MALVDALGNLVRFILLPGQRHDSVGVAPLISGPALTSLPFVRLRTACKAHRMTASGKARVSSGT